MYSTHTSSKVSGALFIIFKNITLHFNLLSVTRKKLEKLLVFVFESYKVFVMFYYCYMIYDEKYLNQTGNIKILYYLIS